MGRPSKTVYIYKNHQYIGTYNTIKDASMATGDSTTTVRCIAIGKTDISPRGYVYSFAELTEEEIQQLPTKEEGDTPPAPRNNQECKKVIGKLELEVPCSDHKVFYTGRNKQERLHILRHFIASRLQTRWMAIPENMATLEKAFLNELIDSIYR